MIYIVVSMVFIILFGTYGVLLNFFERPNVTNQERFLSYLDYYESMDLEKIAEMFTEEVTLRDWMVFVKGKAAALKEINANFQAAQSIQIQLLHLYETSNSVAGELMIRVNGDVELFVADVVDFDTNGKIKAIRAFLGGGEKVLTELGSEGE